MCYGVPDMEGAGMEPMLTVDQVAERLQVNEYTVRRWLRAGELEGVAFGGRTGWRVKEKDLQAFLERRRQGRETGKAAA
jgi:excisionase family DNA binding protein